MTLVIEEHGSAVPMCGAGQPANRGLVALTPGMARETLDAVMTVVIITEQRWAAHDLRNHQGCS